MDKFVVRRAGPSSAESARNDETPSERQPKRIKTEHEDHKPHDDPRPIAAAGAGLPSQKNLLDEEDDGESSGDGDSALVADSYEGIPFEEPLASIESLDEVIDGSYSGADPESTMAAPRYRSSIYVDAFNIALDTVLEQEEHLFNEKEKAVFGAWRRLDYEAQYLYVRLFLRKQAAWHRTQRLGYHSDISDLQAAINGLQESIELPPCQEDAAERTSLSETVPQEWTLDSSFVFAQAFEDVDTTVQDAISLLSVDELKSMAKQMKAVGKTKAELQSAIVHMATKQLTLLSAGLQRQPSTDGTPAPELSRESAGDLSRTMGRSSSSSREGQLVEKIMAITGPCIRICPSVFKLFERVHLVFYRTSEWTEKSLTTIVLAKMSKRNFPEYVVSRTANIFESRQQLLDFEEALRLEYKVDCILNFEGPAGEDGFKEVVLLFHSITRHWRGLLRDEQRRQDQMLDFNDSSYLRRFKAAHVFTRVAHYAAHCLGRLHKYHEEYTLLNELLGQRLLHLARRGAWYQRKALLEERYMAVADPSPRYSDASQQKKHWCRKALETCEQALQDRDCHLIYHYDLQKRIVKLEKRLRIPRRLQHDFGHLRLLAPEEHFVEGVQIKREGGEFSRKTSQDISAKTIWLDELEDNSECSVEAMCLSDYRKKGWKGYHSEGGIVRTLFAYLFFDILFLYIPNVFQTAYQACPLDLHTDVFYAARASEINRRLVEIANGEAPRIVREVHASQFERRTCIVGLKWDFELEDVVELAACFNGDALALVCKVLAQEYRQRGGGMPDLLLWRMEPKPEVLFSEVKSANDRLSDTQRMWIHVFAGAGVRVAVCHAITKQVRIR